MNVIIVTPLILGAFTFTVVKENQFLMVNILNKILPIREVRAQDELLKKLTRLKSTVP